MLVIAQIQTIKDSLTRLLGKVRITDGANDAGLTSDGRLKVDAEITASSDGSAKRLDWATQAVLYAGWARAGAAASAASWKIRRRSFSGDDFVDEWADGDSECDNVWDDRASLYYS